MHPGAFESMTRHRILSVASLVLLLLSASTLFALQAAHAAQSRGMPDGFPPPIRGAEEVRMGVNVALEQYDDATLDQRLNDLRHRGVRYIRQVFRWNDIEPRRGAFDWATSDRLINAAQRHGLRVLAVLHTTPEWARLPSGSEQFPANETQPPAEAADFAKFAGAFAQRYDGRQTTDDGPLAASTSPILAYQIWDEPNLLDAWGNSLANPELYLKMLRGAREAIRAADPSAIIVLAALAPTVEQGNVNPAPQLYLRRLYEMGGQDAFDVAAAKPYGFEYPPDDRRVDAGLLNFSHVILLREEMVAHGDGGKAIWLTQFGWNSLPDDWQGKKSIWGSASEAEQADYTYRAVQRVGQEWPWTGAMFIESLQPAVDRSDAHWGFALLDPDQHPRPVYEAFINALHQAQIAPRAQWFVQPVGQASSLSMGQAGSVGQVTNLSYQPNPLATFSEGWRFGELGADIPERPDARVTFTFNGDSLALIVRRDNYRAYTFVTIDGRPANLLPMEERGAYLIMTSPNLAPTIDTIAVADQLGPGPHTAEVTVDRGWNQWALIGWSSRASDDFGFTILDLRLIAALVGIVAGVMLVWSAPRAEWGNATHALKSKWLKQDRRLTWQVVAAGLAFWFAASMTWAQDAAHAYRNLGTPANVVITALASAVAFWSPVFVVSLIALAALFVLVLLRLDLGLMLLAFFIPFYIVPQRLFERAFSMAELLTLMCLASWGIRVIRNWGLVIRARRVQLPITNLHLLDFSVLALVLVAVLSALQAEFSVEAFRELRVVIVEPALVYLILRTTRLEREQIWRIADGFVLGALTIAGIGLFNFVRGDTFSAELGFPRIKSIFGSPNNDALYLERAFAVLLAGALVKPHAPSGLSSPRQAPALPPDCQIRGERGRRWLYALALVPVTLALALSASRGALVLGAPAAVLAVCLAAGGRWRYAAYAMLAVMLLGLVVLVSGVAQPLVAGTRFESMLDLTRGTGFFRMNLWQSAIRMIADHPLLGVGPDNFLYAYRGFYITPAAWQEPGLSHPHNVVLDFAARLGLLGLAAGVLVMGGAVWQAVRAVAHSRVADPGLRPLAIGLFGLLAAMLAHGLVDHSFFLVDLAFVFMLACGLTAQIRRSTIGS